MCVCVCVCVCVCMFSLRFFGLMVKVEPSDVDSFTIKKKEVLAIRLSLFDHDMFRMPACLLSMGLG